MGRKKKGRSKGTLQSGVDISRGGSFGSEEEVDNDKHFLERFFQVGRRRSIIRIVYIICIYHPTSL